MPKISVIMPVYNTKEEYLREAIESILNQTFSDFEFIIIDDLSTNNVPSILKEYQEKDNRIKIIQGEHKGIASVRNKGLEVAKGEYIAIMDSDDISYPTRFQKQVDFLDKNKNFFVCGSNVKIFQNKNEITNYKEVISYFDILEIPYISNPSAMIKKSLLDKLNLKYNPDFKVTEDYELWSRLIRYTKFYNIQEVLLKYRWHENNVSVTRIKEEEQAADEVKQNMLDFLTDDIILQEKIKDMIFFMRCYSRLEQIFSIKNHSDKIHKVITILGVHIKIKRRKHA